MSRDGRPHDSARRARDLRVAVVRLDRLSVDERTVLEAASIVGEVFERSTVHALLSDAAGSGIDVHLGSLLRKDLIRPSRSNVGGDEAFRFRHILLRDAAYDAVPKGDRAELHEAFAANLDASLGERASEFDEFTGYHLEQAHRLRAELGISDERTVSLARAGSERLGAAGRRAFQRGTWPRPRTSSIGLRSCSTPMIRIACGWRGSSARPSSSPARSRRPPSSLTRRCPAPAPPGTRSPPTTLRASAGRLDSSPIPKPTSSRGRRLRTA